MGYKIHQEYVDNESGGKGRGKRKEFSRMFEDAFQRKFDLVLFWVLDRFTREDLQKTVYCSGSIHAAFSLTATRSHVFTPTPTLFAKYY